MCTNLCVSCFNVNNNPMYARSQNMCPPQLFDDNVVLFFYLFCMLRGLLEISRVCKLGDMYFIAICNIWGNFMAKFHEFGNFEL